MTNTVYEMSVDEASALAGAIIEAFKNAEEDMTELTCTVPVNKLETIKVVIKR